MPLKSRIEIGAFGRAAFSPKLGEIGSNSAAASFSIMPTKCAATGVGVNTWKSALTWVWSASATSLRLQSGRS